MISKYALCTAFVDQALLLMEEQTLVKEQE